MHNPSPAGLADRRVTERRAVMLGKGARLLEVDSVSVRVEGTNPYEILSDVSLSLSAGDVLGLVGESGSGKTTLSLALLGYARPGTVLSGSVRIDGTEIVATTEAER